MPFQLDRKTLGIAALCAGGVAILLHPVSLAALGLGVWLGCRGRDWLRTNLGIGGIDHEDCCCEITQGVPGHSAHPLWTALNTTGEE